MSRKSLFLACMVALALGVNARADYFTTSIHVRDTFPVDQSHVNEISGANLTGTTVSYTVNTKSPQFGKADNSVFITGVTQYQAFSQFPASGGPLLQSIGGHQLVAVYAIEGTQTAGLPTLTASLDKGVIKFYDLGTNVGFSVKDPTTWTNGVLVYTGVIGPKMQTLVGTTTEGNGTSGQPLAGQNQASFNASTGTQTAGAVVVLTHDNPLTEFTPNLTPPIFDFGGFQFKIQETNDTTLVTGSAGFPTNGALDTAFNFIGGGIVPFDDPAPFTNFGFAPDGTGGNGDTVQSIGSQAFPILPLAAPPPPPGIPEIDPSSIAGALTLLGGGLMYLTERRRRNKK
jgi:hypothetical protein